MSVSISHLVWIHLLKIQLLRGTNVYLRQLGHYFPKRRFLSNFESMRFLRHDFLLMVWHMPCLQCLLVVCLILFSSQVRLFLVEHRVFRSTFYVRDVRPFVTKLDSKALNLFIFFFLWYFVFRRVLLLFPEHGQYLVSLIYTSFASQRGERWVVNWPCHRWTIKCLMSKQLHHFLQ